MQNADPPNTPPTPAEEPYADDPHDCLIGEPDWCQVGELDLGGMTLAEVELEPWCYLEGKGITDETIKQFGRDFGIVDLQPLALTFAGFAQAVDEAEPSEAVHLWCGMVFDAPPDAAAKFERVARLVLALERELNESYPNWPFNAVAQADRLGKALQKYRTWLEEHHFESIKKDANAPAKHKERAAADWLAVCWPGLTGEVPTSPQPRTDRTKDGRPPPETSRFYKAFVGLCDLFGLEKPAPVTVGGWLKDSSGARIEIWRGFEQAVSKGLLTEEARQQTDT